MADPTIVVGICHAFFVKPWKVFASISLAAGRSPAALEDRVKNVGESQAAEKKLLLEHR